jgi:hypothetical protein
LTFVVVGGGFSGVEIVGELNDFVLDSIKYFYHNLQKTYTKVVLVNSGQRILPEVTEELAEFALEKIRHKYIPPETIGAYGRSEYPARFFHVSVKNLHKDVSARNCVAYLERYNILDRTTSEETNSRLLVHEPVELKWKGMITQSVLIPPNTNRKFDALFLYDNLPHLPHIGVNSFLADLSDYSFKLRGVGSYELDYIVYSDNFPAIRSTYVLEVDQELSKTRFYRKQK